MIAASAADQHAPSLERLLLAAVRLEFRGEVLVAPRASPLLGSGCEVAGCTGYEHYRPWGRTVGRALCELHGQRWIKEGRPEIEAWLARAEPLRALCRASRCEIAGCARSVYFMHRCGGHQRHADVVSKQGDEECLVSGCGFPTVPGKALCDTHLRRFHQRSRNRPLTTVEFVAEVDGERERAQGAYVLRPVAGALRLELQYLLQHEHDAGRALRPRLFNDTVAVLARESPRSLLDRDVAAWRELARAMPTRRLRLTGAVMALAYRRLCELGDHAGDPWAPDRWTIARLPLAGAYDRHRTRSLDFATIGRPWLRKLLKRWARYRLQTGTLKPQGVWRAVWSFRELERFLSVSGIELARAEDLSRTMLVDFLDHVAQLPLAPNTRRGLLRGINIVLADVDRHGWARLQRDARYYPGELPAQSETVPRFIDETVMRQLETDQALARLADETTMTAVLVLIETGLRSDDALQLPADPVVMLPDGSPVLRFVNHKRNREAAIPISDRLLERIRHQQAHNARAFPNGSPWLLPAIGPCNGQGQTPYSAATLRDRLRAWLAELELLDAHGRRVTVTAHQFRHTLGTRMINKDVPLEVIRRMLDHGSLQMTQVYSRLSDAKLREHFDTYHERVNRRGEKVTLTTDGVLGEAAWTKERLARARQALPNGYCGLPLQQRCPHPNACLSCESFLTDPTFLDQHREHLARVDEQLEKASENGWQRIAESNESDRINLINIIDGLERLQTENASEDRAA